ncbi:efflux RND transporter permease subunit [Saccharospirillum impatiens]|uniref:efflux RND transporter permease subunit n=1 Tax=Saccharospirillum impatiens TaxID=169438 RepID=UPI000421B4C6|nr:MMPL family transporter [Saccharospirillum impatiens]
MQPTRQASWLDRYTNGVMRHPWPILAGLVLFMVALGSQLPQLQLDTDLEHFIDDSTAARQAYNAAKETYGRNDVIVVGIEAPDVLSDAHLSRLADLHRRIEQQVPWVRRVDSLLNVPYQEGTADGLTVDDLVPASVGTLDRATIEQRIAATPALEGLVINAERTFTTLVIEPYTYDFDPRAVSDDASAFDRAFDGAFADSSSSVAGASGDGSDTFLPIEKTNELITALNAELVATDGLDAVLAGMPVINQQLEMTMKREMQTFISLTILLIIAVLIAFFRRVSAVVIPLTAVILAILATFASLSLAGQTVQMPLILVPSFLLAITVGDAIHVMTHFFKGYNAGQGRYDAMRLAIRRTALPMLLTSLTTAAGLATLASGDLIPIANLGLFSALGVMLAFALTVLLMPALMSIWPLSAPRLAPASMNESASGQGPVHWVLRWFAELSVRRGAWLAGLWLLAVVAALALAVQLRFSFDPLNWMPQSLPIRTATDTIDARLSGTINMDVIIDTGEENGLKNPQMLTRLDEALTQLEAGRPGGVRIGHVNSLLDIIKGTHQALNSGDADYYRIPDTASLLAEELILFENSGADELSRLVSPDYREMKITLIMPWADILHYQAFIDVTEQTLSQALTPWAEVRVAGLLPLLSATLNEVVTTTAWSYGLAAIAITVMMMALLRSISLGALAMLPNLAPILVVMGLMQALNIPLDLFTMLVATVAIGITVDNTVHFAHHFRTAFAETGDAEQAVDLAFEHAGPALLTTAVVLTIGFYVFLFSDVSSIFHFGLLSGTAFLLAVLSNFTLTPVLLRWYAPRLKQETTS